MGLNAGIAGIGRGRKIAGMGRNGVWGQEWDLQEWGLIFTFHISSQVGCGPTDNHCTTLRVLPITDGNGSSVESPWRFEIERNREGEKSHSRDLS